MILYSINENTKDEELKLHLISHLMYNYIFEVLKDLGISYKKARLNDLLIKTEFDTLVKEVQLLTKELVNIFK